MLCIVFNLCKIWSWWKALRWPCADAGLWLVSAFDKSINQSINQQLRDQRLIVALFTCGVRRRGAGDSDVSPPPPPVWNLRAVSLIPLSYYISSLALLSSFVAFSVLSFFCFWSILLTSFPLNLLFPKGRFFCVALVGFVWAVRRWVL